jgi:serine/threonine protein kinase
LIDSLAVKGLLPLGIDDAAKRRFERECEAMGSLSWHPNILTIYDAGTTDVGRLFLTMELAPEGRRRSPRAHGPAAVEGSSEHWKLDRERARCRGLAAYLRGQWLPPRGRQASAAERDLIFRAPPPPTSSEGRRD